MNLAGINPVMASFLKPHLSIGEPKNWNMENEYRERLVALTENYHGQAKKDVLVSVLFNEWMLQKPEIIELMVQVAGKKSFYYTSDFEKVADYLLP